MAGCNSYFDCDDEKTRNLGWFQILKLLITKDTNGCPVVRTSSSASKKTKVTGFVKNITNTTANDVIAATVGKKINITQIIFTNASVTVGTLVDILDNSTVIYSGYAGPENGFVLNFPTDNPLELTTSNKLAVKCVTTGADVTVSANGFLD